MEPCEYFLINPVVKCRSVEFPPLTKKFAPVDNLIILYHFSKFFINLRPNLLETTSFFKRSNLTMFYEFLFFFIVIWIGEFCAFLCYSIYILRTIFVDVITYKATKIFFFILFFHHIPKILPNFLSHFSNSVHYKLRHS